MTSPNQLALQYKEALEKTGAFVVEPDGRVKMAANRGGGYAPPWVWAGALPEASGNDPQSMALRQKLSLPSSDPNSPWRESVPYSEGGPFTKHSQWDSQNGTYEGGIDWGTLLGTAAVGSLFAAPAIAGMVGGGGGAAAGTGAASTAAADGGFGVGSLTAASTGLPVTTGLGTAGAGTLASTPIASGLFTAPTSAGTNVAGMATTTSAPGIGSKLLGGLKSPNNLADLSKVIQQYGTDAQGNRAIKGNMAGQYDRNMLAAEAQRNSSESDAIKKLNIANYILNGPQNGYQPGSITLNGQTRQLPTYGSGFIAPSDAMRQGATDIQAQAQSRLKPGGTYQPLPFSEYGTPGADEQVSNYLGTGLGIAGTIANMYKK